MAGVQSALVRLPERWLKDVVTLVLRDNCPVCPEAICNFTKLYKRVPWLRWPGMRPNQGGTLLSVRPGWNGSSLSRVRVLNRKP